MKYSIDKDLTTLAALPMVKAAAKDFTAEFRTPDDVFRHFRDQLPCGDWFDNMKYGEKAISCDLSFYSNGIFADKVSCSANITATDGYSFFATYMVFFTRESDDPYFRLEYSNDIHTGEEQPAALYRKYALVK